MRSIIPKKITSGRNCKDRTKIVVHQTQNVTDEIVRKLSARGEEKFYQKPLARWTKIK